MGHKNKKSLTRQIQEMLDSKLAIGESKHQAKIQGTANDKIYSWSTYKTYMKHMNYFADWCKVEYGCKTVDDCREHAAEWLESRSDLSAYTQKLELSALSKFYGCKSEEFGVDIDKRLRSNIIRSRGNVERDRHFSEEKHRDFVDFCRSTGLRRSELEGLTGDKLVQKDDSYWILVNVGSKGGRERLSPVVEHVDLVVDMMRSAGSDKVFDVVPNGADVHSYRADYCTSVYNAYARPIDEIPFDRINRGSGCPYQSDVYRCRGEFSGVKMDKAAMRIASEALGHNRIGIVASHYIRR